MITTDGLTTRATITRYPTRWTKKDTKNSSTSKLTKRVWRTIYFRKRKKRKGVRSENPPLLLKKILLSFPSRL